MTQHSITHAFFSLACIATFTLFGPSVAEAGGYDDSTVKKVKVRDHKVKVKTVGGKAKIKNKANGKYKVKVKGPNGDHAAAIADEAFRGQEPAQGK